MPKLFNQDTIASEAVGQNVRQQELIDGTITSRDNVYLNRWEFGVGGLKTFEVRNQDLVWLQVLDGKIELQIGTETHHLNQYHLVFLPGGSSVSITSVVGATVLSAKVPDAERFDPDYSSNPPGFKLIDWSKEPVLNSRHDARKRIYFVTPTLFSTKAISGEMIIYPPNTLASNHYHEGAEHFQYVIRGTGRVYCNGQPRALRAGDIVYNYELEQHYFECVGTEDFVFVEFFVPGEFETVWVDDAPVCTWEPTGKNILGGKPSRDIPAHRVSAPDAAAKI